MKLKIIALLLCVALCFSVTNLSARSKPKHYSGYFKQKREFKKRHDACVAEQNRIMLRYK